MFEFINKYQNTVLVIITAIYAYYTFRMVKIMNKQVVSQIRISDIKLGSCFERKKENREESNFLNMVIQTPIKTLITSYNFYFELYFDVRNGSAGGGSIDKPELVLKYKNKYLKNWHDAECVIEPITEKGELDLGRTIYLKGGDSDKIKLEYMTHPVLNKNIDSFKSIIALIKDDPSRLEYFIRYKDNIGKSYEVKVENVVSDRDC